MQVGAVNQSNYTPQQSFKGGIHNRLYQVIAEDGGDSLKISNKINEIYHINRPQVSLESVIYNIKEKTAQFMLSVEDNLRHVHGMENIKPEPVVAKGESVSEAFCNISPEELRKANDKLVKRYNEQYIATEPQRQAFEARCQAVLDKMKQHVEEVAENYRKTYGC